MFERFTDRARRVITLANQEAMRLQHDHVGTEHLLLGLVREATGMAAVVLREFNVDLGVVRQQVERFGHGPMRAPEGGRRRTERFGRVIGYAIDEAAGLEKNYVGTEHLLLGLLREPEGTAAQVLAKMDLRVEQVREAVLRLLGRTPRGKDVLLEQAMRDLAMQLADETIDASQVRRIAEALIGAGWRPQQ